MFVHFTAQANFDGSAFLKPRVQGAFCRMCCGAQDFVDLVKDDLESLIFKAAQECSQQRIVLTLLEDLLQRFDQQHRMLELNDLLNLRINCSHVVCLGHLAKEKLYRGHNRKKYKTKD